MSLSELLQGAMQLALDLRQPICACFYLALARSERTVLVTDDETMITAARKARIEVQRI